MTHVVMFSGGVGSWAAAKRVAAVFPAPVLLFCDTLIEDADLYRFLGEAAQNVGGRLVRIVDGRTPWEVFRDERFLGNSRVAPCSEHLKSRLACRWVETNCDPATTTLYLGIDWTEEHRLHRARAAWAPWHVEAPLCEPPLRSKADLLSDMVAAGIRPPRLYEMGFPHNNCGGFCVKAGQAHFRNLLRTMPDRYAWHEAREEEMRNFLGRDVSIMKDRRGGKTRPLTMRQFRHGLEDGRPCDPFDWGGCGCFTDNDHSTREADNP